MPASVTFDRFGLTFFDPAKVFQRPVPATSGNMGAFFYFLFSIDYCLFQLSIVNFGCAKKQANV